MAKSRTCNELTPSRQPANTGLHPTALGAIVKLAPVNAAGAGARRAGQGRAAATRTLDAPKPGPPTRVFQRVGVEALPHNQSPERRLDQPRMSFSTNRPTSGTVRNSPGLATFTD